MGGLVGPVVDIIYVGDPMCSWCWGIAPELERLQAGHELGWRVVVGGLRPGPAAEPMTDRMADFLAHHWRLVRARSGQPFDETMLARRDWVYDTEPAARAVVTLRRLAPESTLGFFTRIQQAFYAQGRDVTDLDLYEDLVEGFCGEPDRFMEELRSERSRAEAWRDFAEARALGVTGFPTVLARQEDKTWPLAIGYTTADWMDAALHRGLGHPDDALVCSAGRPC